MTLNLALLRRDLVSGFQQKLSSALPLPPPSGDVQVVTGPGSIAFMLDGVLRWMVDEKWFGGAPVLTYDPGRIELKDALYAGTGLSADFVCLLGPKNVPFGTPIDMAMKLGGFKAQAVLERWLAGTQPLESPVTLPSPVCPLGSGGNLSIQGAALSCFAPNWLTSYTGTKVASITGLGASHDSDTFGIRVMLAQEPSFRSAPKQKRTLLTMERGSNNWDL
jgi:hypothetical protein